MNISRFFIDRPIFAGVLSIVIFVLGAISAFQLPISEYPEVVPPTVIVRATYPGANPQVIADTVAAPLEQEINGVEKMLYYTSTSNGDGSMTITVTFKLGTDLDIAQVQVQNRVSQALPRLPEVVKALGVTTQKSSPDLTMVVHLVSPDGRYDDKYLHNYARIQVKDQLARLEGMGDVQLFGSGDYSMRVWLDPEKTSSRGLTSSDVVKALRDQNIQVAAGTLGQSPAPRDSSFQISINTSGRLVTEDQFREVVVKSDDGNKVFLKDIARVELGASSYALRSLLDNKTAVAMTIFLLPGANALDLSTSVRKTMAELKTSFPEGLDYTIAYDPTQFVRSSIEEVVQTLFEALVLVVLVVLVFLQTWRASIIPIIAVPVSLVGTFAVMKAVGFSINALSLFGLVLAIGIVVDDAIVVVENVERNIALGLEPKEATKQAMKEVSGPIVAIALVLCAVFVPIGFVPGLTGQFYRQFALTIAISTVISAFNSLTLSPALAGLLLRGHGAKKDIVTRGMEKSLGWFFRPFNRFFDATANRYVGVVRRIVGRPLVSLVVYAGLVGLAYLGFAKVPTGFIPTQDKGYLVAFAQLPDAASLERTDDVIRKMSKIAMETPGVNHAIAFPGLSINGFINSSNAGIVFINLDDFSKRTSPELSGPALAAKLGKRFAAEIDEAIVPVFPPPPVQGLGTIGGFKMYVEDRGDLGPNALHDATAAFIGGAQKTADLTNLYSGYQVDVPQLWVDLDRTKAKEQGIAVNDVFETMQAYLGSVYVNDFNRFGRTFQVNIQADSDHRLSPEDVLALKTRNERGAMVPLGSVLSVRASNGPDRVVHYNGFPAAEVNGAPSPGKSTGQALAAVAAVAKQELPRGMTYEWTEIMYQQILAGNTALFVFPFCVLLVFLVLAAQYESWSLPLSVILIVPMCLLAAITGVWLTKGDNNVFTQIGLFVLVGLACKNAILIVEFAKDKEAEEGSAVAAVLAACRLRLRPILMTSIAFILGVWPLVSARGAGSEMRQAMGIAVFSGMLGVTFFGLLLTPVFFVVLRRRALAKKNAAIPPPPDTSPLGFEPHGAMAEE